MRQHLGSAFSIEASSPLTQQTLKISTTPKPKTGCLVCEREDMIPLIGKVSSVRTVGTDALQRAFVETPCSLVIFDLEAFAVEYGI